LGVEFGNEGGADAIDDVGGNDANNDYGPTAKPKKSAMTEEKDWTMHIGGGEGCIVTVPYTGESMHFGVKLEKGNLEKMQDEHGTIHFHLVFDWLLQMFGESLDENGFYEFVAAQICNYIIQIMRKRAFKPEHSNPFDKKCVTADHIACFYGYQLVHVIKGLPLVEDCWSTCKALDAIGTAKESMPCRVFLKNQRCMQFAEGRSLGWKCC
jgi:hypothetical protein